MKFDIWAGEGPNFVWVLQIQKKIRKISSLLSFAVGATEGGGLFWKVRLRLRVLMCLNYFFLSLQTVIKEKSSKLSQVLRRLAYNVDILFYLTYYMYKHLESLDKHNISKAYNTSNKISLKSVIFYALQRKIEYRKG